jgi:hypothetical protein
MEAVVANCQKAAECGVLTGSVDDCVKRTELNREMLSERPECEELVKAFDAFIQCTASRSCEELAIPAGNSAAPCYAEARAADGTGTKCRPL